MKQSHGGPDSRTSSQIPSVPKSALTVLNTPPQKSTTIRKCQNTASSKLPFKYPVARAFIFFLANFRISKKTRGNSLVRGVVRGVSSHELIFVGPPVPTRKFFLPPLNVYDKYQTLCSRKPSELLNIFHISELIFLVVH